MHIMGHPTCQMCHHLFALMASSDVTDIPGITDMTVDNRSVNNKFGYFRCAPLGTPRTS
jgi:hypothetical protein